MKTTEGTKQWIDISLVLIMLVFALGACRTPAGRTTGEVVDDSTITTKVKSQILGEDILRGLAIDVDTFEGNVTLTGAVKTEAQKERAEELAKNVYGVKKVNNLLTIRGA